MPIAVQRCQKDDRRAVLVIVEDGDVQALFQSFLNFKTARRRDIFQIDPAKDRSDAADRLDDLIDILGVQADREGVDVAEFFEQDSLSFHDRHPGFGADIAKAQDRGAVSDHSHQVPLCSIAVDVLGVRGDPAAGFRDARRIGGAEVFHGSDSDLRDDLDLSSVFFVKRKCGLIKIHLFVLSVCENTV